MKSTVIVIVSLVTVFVIGLGTTQLYHGQTSDDPATPTVVKLSENRSVAVDASRPGNSTPGQRSARQPSKESRPPVLPRNTSAVDGSSLTFVGFKYRRVARSDDHETWTWRVEVKNESDRSRFCYVEVEWLDAAGRRVDGAHELRRIEPGSHSISMVHKMGSADAAKVTTVRVAKLEVRRAPIEE